MIEYISLGDLATIKTNFEDADFWIQRVGNVGMPTKDFVKGNIGIKLSDDGSRVLDKRFLWYQLIFLHSSGYWSKIKRDGAVMPFIAVSDVKDILLGVTAQ